MRSGFLLLILPFVASAQTAIPPEHGNCPTDKDLSNIDTRLSAKVVTPKNQQALHTQRTLAIQCRALRGQFSHAQWERFNAVLRGEE